MAGISQGRSVSTIAGEGYSWDSVSLDAPGVSLGGGFSPQDLFFYGEQGAWYDPSDLTTMFQDLAGTTPVTADGQPVGKILDKSGRGNHATAPSDAARPLYKTDGTYHWLQLDGVDDSLSTAAIDFTGTDKMSVFSGVYVNTTQTLACTVELSNSFSANNGSFFNGYSEVSTGATLNYLRGTATGGVRLTGNVTIPRKEVTSTTYDIAEALLANEIKPRVNGATAASSVNYAGPSGTGNFGNYPIYIGRRGNVGSSILTGNIYSMIIRGALSTTQEITDTETWVNSKTGAY